jgi:hypothetical protein
VSGLQGQRRTLEQVAVRGVNGEGCLALTKNSGNTAGTVEEREYTAEEDEQPVTVSDHRSINR